MGQAEFMLRQIVCIPIKGYQYLIRPVLRPCCRFYPSCSQYAEDAISKYGVCQGILMALKRLLRCHPWSPGGHDPLP
jgi:putative membrane protein insertion efficiency factor